MKRLQWAMRLPGRMGQAIRNWSTRKKIILAVMCFLLLLFLFALPAKLFQEPTSYYITDRQGNLLNASIASDGQWRFPYNPDVPEKFAKCIVTLEDQRFWYHPGVDPLAMGRAFRQNSKGMARSGASTISMQVIRLHKKNNNRNWWNKIKETILAVRLECSYRKKSILALYASYAPFGSNVVGLDAAAWRYYGRPAKELSWGEMAALAVLPNAPALVHPGKNREILLKKRDRLLDKLQEKGILDATNVTLAKLEPLPGKPYRLPQEAPHLLDRFRKELPLLQQVNDELSTGIRTSIDGRLQQHLNRIVRVHHEQLRGNFINNIAALVVENETGQILGYVGNVYDPSRSYLESHVDVLSSPRSPGSTLKPLLYASMLSSGNLMPHQLIPDVPIQIGGYSPKNFDLGYDGAVSASNALARSLNIPAVKMLQEYKYQRFYDILKQCGITTLSRPADHYGMSLILGGCEVTPFELAGVYSSMARMYNHQNANKGKWKSSDWFMPAYAIPGQDEEALRYLHASPTSALFDPTAMWYTFNAMNEVMRPNEEGLWTLFNSAQKIAWKTGTSFGFRDAWAVGLTPLYTVVVWAGNTHGEGRPGLIGVQTAAPILFDIFRELPTSPWFPPPTSEFMYQAVCKRSGFKAGPDCESRDTIMTSKAAASANNCPYCRTIHLNTAGTQRVNASCEEPDNIIHRSWFILPPTMEYYYKSKDPYYKTLPPIRPGCETETQKVLDLIYPDDGIRIYVPVELSGKKGNVVFKATHKNSKETIYWHLDNVYQATTQYPHQLSLAPSPGWHTLTIVDKDGNSAVRRFEVLE